MLYGNIYCESLSENSLFDVFSPRNSDGLFTPYIILRDKLLQQGIELNTPDINTGRDIALEVHMDGRPLDNNGIPKYLIASENPLINQFNADAAHLKNYSRVFSWNEAALRYPGAVLTMVPNVISIPNARSFADRKIFSCLISSNKVAPWLGPDDLYAERVKVIRWYERHAPAFFHLYGRGWGKHSHVFSMGRKIVRGLGRLRTQLFGYKPFPAWQGEVEVKSEILSNVKFSYCYENVKDMSNYITEKIFDSFFAGCVPIYWGANNILDYIPENCFIDRRNFKDTAEVHRFLLSVTPEQHALYQQNIAEFLRSERSYVFNAENFATTIASTIASDFPEAVRRQR